MFWTQPDQYVLNGDNTHKGAMILHNFGSASIFFWSPHFEILQSLM